MKSSLLFLLLMVVVSDCAGTTIAITTKSLPNGTVKAEYSAVINTTNGCVPFKWAIVAGSLPAGITEKPSKTTTSLDLSGIPTTAGTYSFTVAATGCAKLVSKVSYKVTIQASANHVVDLKWKASTSKNVAGYNVYRSTNGTTWKKMNAGLIASTLYSDSTVANGTVYYYAATSVNIEGKESAKTTSIKVDVP